MAVMIKGGNPCPRCGAFMRRFKHDERWKPEPWKRSYATYWDRCKPCHETVFYPEAMVEQPKPNRAWKKNKPRHKQKKSKYSVGNKRKSDESQGLTMTDHISNMSHFRSI